MSKFNQYLENKTESIQDRATLRGDVSRLYDILNMSPKDFKRFYADSESRMDAFQKVLDQLNQNFKRIKL